jgi:hypothetical protein
LPVASRLRGEIADELQARRLVGLPERVTHLPSEGLGELRRA